MSSFIEITPELMAGFLDEAPEYLEMLDAGLTELEAKAGSGAISLEAPEDQERMNTMFRAAHSLKGLAAAFGFEKIKELTHRMETLFDQVRMRKRDLATDSFEALFTVFDRLKALVSELSDPDGEPVEIEDVLSALDRILESDGDTPAAEPLQGEAPKAAAVSALSDNDVLADPELVTIFLETTSESLDEMNQGLLALEQNPGDGDLLNRISRCAHNIKGASGAAGLAGMQRVTHDMETVLDRLRSGGLVLNDELANVLFQGVDRIRACIEHLAEGILEDVVADDVCEQIHRWFADDGNAPGQEPSSDAGETDGDLPEGQFAVEVSFRKDFDEAAIQAYLIHNRLSDLTTILATQPDLDTIGGDAPLHTVVFIVEGEVGPQALCDAVSAYTVEGVKVTGHATPTDEEVRPVKKGGADTVVPATDTTPPAKPASPPPPTASAQPPVEVKAQAVKPAPPSTTAKPAGAPTEKREGRGQVG